MLRRLWNSGAAEWVTRDLPKTQPASSPAWKGNLVSHCLPSGFASYCKLLHPIYVDEDANDLSLSWAASDDDSGMPGKLASVGSGADPTGRRVRWEEVAKKHDLVFHAEFSDLSLRQAFPDASMPRYLLGPDEGTLDRPTCSSLVRVLESHVPSEGCFFYYDLIATKEMDAPLLFVGGLAGVLDSPALEAVYGTPTYWWPESRSWCVCSDWDLAFTLVGGPESLIKGLVQSEDLEVLIVREDSRIDDKSDRVNRGSAG